MSDHLTEDIWLDILARLPVKTLLQARCVSKTWDSLIKSPSFITHHLNKKATSKNNDLLFFNNNDSYFLYPHKDFPEFNGHELDFPLEKLRNLHPGCNGDRTTTLVGSCHGVFCLFRVYFNVYKSKSAHMVILWNPSIRKTVPIPEPNVTSQSHGYFEDFLGLGFDSNTQDYKLVRIVYLQTSLFYNKETILPPLVEVYSLKSGCWRMVENDLKYVIKEGSRSAFVNGACHWTVTSRNENTWRRALKVIVFFNLADEKIGEMILPDCMVYRDDLRLVVTVFDGLLSLVALSGQYYHQNRPERYPSIWAMKEYGDSQSWTKLFNIEHLNYVYSFVGLKKNGEVFLSVDGQLTSYSRTKNGSCKIWGTKIWCSSPTLDSYMESLVLLDEVSSTSTDADSVSKEHSSGLDKNEREKKMEGKKNTESPEIVSEENRVFSDGVISSAASRNMATNEGDGDSDFGAKNRKQKERKKKKKGKNNMDCIDEEDNELPENRHSCASEDNTENERKKAPKEKSSSISSTVDKKNKKKKGKNYKNE